MKHKTALKQSIGAVKFQVVFVAVTAIVAAEWTNGYTLFMLGVGVLYLVMEVINVIYIKRKAAQNPAFLDQKLQ